MLGLIGSAGVVASGCVVSPHRQVPLQSAQDLAIALGLKGAELGALSVGRVVEEDGWSTDVRVGVLVRSGQSRFDFLDLSSLTFMQPLWLEFQPLDPHLVRSSLCRSSLFSRAVTEAILESWSRVNLHCDDENGELDSQGANRTRDMARFAPRLASHLADLHSEPSIEKSALIRRLRSCLRLFSGVGSRHEAETRDLLHAHELPSIRPPHEDASLTQALIFSLLRQVETIGAPGTPSARLVELGPTAVPALLAALRLHQPTRQVVQMPDGHKRVLRLSELATLLLEEIIAPNPASVRPISVLAKDWLAQVRLLTYEEFLARRIRAAGLDAPTLLPRLHARDPQLALQAVKEGLEVAEDPWTCLELVEFVGQQVGRQGLGVLRQAMSSGATLCRVRAAHYLRDAGEDPIPKLVETLVRWEIGESQLGLDLLCEYLARCGEERSIVALSSQLERLPERVRVNVFSSLAGRIRLPHSLFGNSLPLGRDSWCSALEQMLGNHVLDLEEEGLGKSIVSDTACDALARLFPGRYTIPGRACSSKEGQQLRSHIVSTLRRRFDR